MINIKEMSFPEIMQMCKGFKTETQFNNVIKQMILIKKRKYKRQMIRLCD